MDNAKKVLVASAIASMSAGLASATTINGLSTGFLNCPVSPTQPAGNTTTTFTCNGTAGSAFSANTGYTLGELVNAGASSVTAITLTKVQLKLGMTLATQTNLNLITTGNATGNITGVYALTFKSAASLPAGFSNIVPAIVGSSTVSVGPVSATSGHEYITASGVVSSAFSPLSKTFTATTTVSSVYASSFQGKFGNGVQYKTTATGEGTIDSGGTAVYDDTAAVDYTYSISEKNLSATPEPASMALMGSALLGLGLAGRKRLRKKA